MALTLVLGGARSGKSSFAERYATRVARDERPVVFVATAQALDAEMATRIARHRATRPNDWVTVEEPVDIPKVLRDTAVHSESIVPVVVIDCLSLLLSNWMFFDAPSARVNGKNSDTNAVYQAELATSADAPFDFEWRVQQLLPALREYPGPIVVVSNEVGSGIVPADAMTRHYRDGLGWLNQSVATIADRVFLVIAGIPVDVRKLASPE